MEVAALNDTGWYENLDATSASSRRREEERGLLTFISGDGRESNNP